jgi:thymidylate synthase
MQTNYTSIHIAIQQSIKFLKENGSISDTKYWQGIESPNTMFEVMNLNWTAPVPQDTIQLRRECRPDVEWADAHFLERIGGEPLNPGESYKKWPGYKDSDFNDSNFRKYDGKFAHTYMERYWPKYAASYQKGNEMAGIRFEYGDLIDVINLLIKDPLTRQAYLPIFFPEDTGAVVGQRVPCTLGYLFYMRESKLHIKYYIRACDAKRHFRNDIYLTCLLLIWATDRMNSTRGMEIYSVGNITMDIASFHVFEKEKNLI